MKTMNPSPKPPCPECIAEVTEVHWEGGFEVHDPYVIGGGTAVGTWDQVKWAATPPAKVKPAPDFDVMTLQPCGHQLRGREQIQPYRDQMARWQSSTGCRCPWNNDYNREPLAAHQHHVDCPQFVDHDDLPPFDDP